MRNSKKMVPTVWGGMVKMDNKEWLRRSIAIVINHTNDKDEQLDNIIRLVEAYEEMKNI